MRGWNSRDPENLAIYAGAYVHTYIHIYHGFTYALLQMQAEPFLKKRGKSLARFLPPPLAIFLILCVTCVSTLCRCVGEFLPAQIYHLSLGSFWNSNNCDGRDIYIGCAGCDITNCCFAKLISADFAGVEWRRKLLKMLWKAGLRGLSCIYSWNDVNHAKVSWWRYAEDIFF